MKAHTCFLLAAFVLLNVRFSRAAEQTSPSATTTSSNSTSAAAATQTNKITKKFDAAGGKYRFTIDATASPDLMEWADTELRPAIQKWYPKIVELLSSEGYSAATNVALEFRENMGGTPAATGGRHVSLNSVWFRKELKGEARGSVIHELVHVVQDYGHGRRVNPNPADTPGWIVEGIADYIRWFLFEPETKGAEISQRGLARARYNASYRVTGNFLDWVTRTYDTNIVHKLNAAARDAKYSEDIWKQSTGKTVQELGDEWKKALEDRLAAKKEN